MKGHGHFHVQAHVETFHIFTLSEWAAEDVAMNNEIQVEAMKVVFPDGKDASWALYANGRHQVKVELWVRKTVNGNAVALTDAERLSAAITAFSDNSEAPLPSGWSCDNKKYDYDAGLWRDGDVNGQGYLGDVQDDVVNLYLRLAQGTVIQPQRFMGRIRIGGTTYTTNMSGSFQSAITVHAALPERMYLTNLIRTTANVFVKDAGGMGHPNTSVVKMYFWRLPSGLNMHADSVREQEVCPVPGTGAGVRTICSNALGSVNGYRCAVLLSAGWKGAVPLKYLYTSIPAEFAEKVVYLDWIPKQLRAISLRLPLPVSMCSHELRWVFQDNFGSEHVFYIESEKSGEILKLKN